MRKFQPGDTYEAIETGAQGTIKAISFNSILQQEEYVIEWSDRPGQEWSYACEECDPDWRLLSRTAYVKSNQPINNFEIKINSNGPFKVECNGHHHWIEVGFNFTKQVCKHCDQEKA